MLNKDIEVLYAIVKEWKKLPNIPLYGNISLMDYYTGIKMISVQTVKYLGNDVKRNHRNTDMNICADYSYIKLCMHTDTLQVYFFRVFFIM